MIDPNKAATRRFSKDPLDNGVNAFGIRVNSTMKTVYHWFSPLFNFLLYL